jgi:hypothetical protein
MQKKQQLRRHQSLSLTADFQTIAVCCHIVHVASLQSTLFFDGTNIITKQIKKQHAVKHKIKKALNKRLSNIQTCFTTYN